MVPKPWPALAGNSGDPAGATGSRWFLVMVSIASRATIARTPGHSIPIRPTCIVAAFYLGSRAAPVSPPRRHPQSLASACRQRARNALYGMYSTLQYAEQPSPETLLPSSHSSPRAGCRMP